MTQTASKPICRHCKLEKELHEVERCTINWIPGWRCKDHCNASIEIMRRQREQREANDGNRSIR